MLPLMMKPIVPVSLMKLLAIPLCHQTTVTKWLVISPTLSRKRATLTQTLSQRERDRSLFPPLGESWIEG